MKFWFYTLLLTFTINNSYAALAIVQPQNDKGFIGTDVEKTLVKTFNIKNNTFIVLNFDGNVEVKEWGETTVRVHANIVLENGNINLLKYLITKGRYNLSLDDVNQGV